jgi:hypothetical protein
MGSRIEEDAARERPDVSSSSEAAAEMPVGRRRLRRICTVVIEGDDDFARAFARALRCRRFPPEVLVHRAIKAWLRKRGFLRSDGTAT